MLRVGITGGIGSGKSTVCKFFTKLGRTVISADEIARELTDMDESVKKEVRKVFGSDSYTKAGKLDRKQVANLVFNNDHLRKRLNRIVHPRVFQTIDHRLEMLSKKASQPYVLIEAALIFETRMEQRLDHTIVVDASEETRIKRVMDRDHCLREDVLQRMKVQLPTARLATKADFVIQNNNGVEELRSKVEFINVLLTRLGTLPV